MRTDAVDEPSLTFGRMELELELELAHTDLMLQEPMGKAL